MHRFIKYSLYIRCMDDKVGEFLEGMPAGAYEVDEQGNYLYCNQEAANILGYDSPEELMQKNIYDLYFSREYRRRILNRMRNAGGKLKSYLHWKRKDGSEVVVDDYAEFVYDDEGNEAGVRGIFVKATYEQLFNDLNAGVYCVGADMKTVLLVNRAAARIFGFKSPEEMEGIDISKLYAHYEDYEKFLKNLKENEKVKNYPLEMKRKDGEIITISVNCRLLRDEKGEITGREGTFTDVTEQEKYKKLLELPLGVYEARIEDGRPIIISCNETFAQMFGYTSNDIVGMNINEFYANKDDISIFEKKLRKKEKQNEPVTDYRLKVKRKKEKEGKEETEEFWIDIFCYPTKNERGEVIGRKGIIKEVTDKMELERSFRKIGKLDFLAGVPAGVFRVDEKGNFLYCNQEAANILGYDSPEELKQKNIYDLYFDPEYRNDLLEKMRLQGGRMETMNLRWKRKDETEIVVNVFSEFAHDDSGKETGVHGIFVDATYERLFDDLNAGVYRVGADMKTVLLVNRAVARIFGFKSPEEMEGIDISKLYVHYEDYEKFLKNLEENERVDNYSLEMKRKDGEIITISVSCRLLRNGKGEIIGREGTFTDVTEQEKYRRLLELPLGVYEAQMKNEKPIIVYCNKKFAEMFGYASEREVRDMNIHELYVNDDDILKFEEKLKEAGQKNESVTDHDLKVKRKKREQEGKEETEEFWITIYCYPTKDEKGEVIGRKGIVIDVTDRMELRRIIKKRKEIQRFIHGFIAPMMSIHSTSQVVAREVERGVGIRYGADDMNKLRKKKRNILNLFEEIKKVSEDLAGKIEKTAAFCKAEKAFSERDIQALIHIEDALRKETKDIIRRIIEVRKLHKDAHDTLSRIYSFVRTERSIADSRPITDQIRSCFVDLDELDSTYLLYLTQSILNKSKIAYHDVEGLRQLMMRSGEEDTEQLFEFQPTNIVDMIEETIDMYRIDASLKGITIHSPRTKISDVEVSQNHVERMLSYIIQNAVKYSFKRDGYIQVGLVDKDDAIQIDVEDYGVGILPEEIYSGKIFEYGYRGEFSRDRNRTGSGIGLSESKRIVEAHGGDIKVMSIPVGEAGEKIAHYTPHKTRVSIILPKKQNAEGG